MAGFGDDTRSDLTLCIFPHLREFVVVDARAGLPDRPRVCTLAVDEVLADNFYTEVEREFASLLKRGESPFLTLMSISQEVEGMVRARVLRSILSRVNSDVDREAGDGSAGVAVVFFTGPLLAMDRAQLHPACRSRRHVRGAGERSGSGREGGRHYRLPHRSTRPHPGRRQSLRDPVGEWRTGLNPRPSQRA